MKQSVIVFFRAVLAVGFVFMFVTGPIMAKDKDDFGEKTEKKLYKESKNLFGFKDPVKSSPDVSTVIARQPGQSAKDRQFLAKGLEAEFVARNVGYLADMISFWPDDVNYTHLMVCIKGDRVPSNAGNGGGAESVSSTCQRKYWGCGNHFIRHELL